MANPQVRKRCRNIDLSAPRRRGRFRLGIQYDPDAFGEFREASLEDVAISWHNENSWRGTGLRPAAEAARVGSVVGIRP